MYHSVTNHVQLVQAAARWTPHGPWSLTVLDPPWSLTISESWTPLMVTHHEPSLGSPHGQSRPWTLPHLWSEAIYTASASQSASFFSFFSLALSLSVVSFATWSYIFCVIVRDSATSSCLIVVTVDRLNLDRPGQLFTLCVVFVNKSCTYRTLIDNRVIVVACCLKKRFCRSYWAVKASFWPLFGLRNTEI